MTWSKFDDLFDEHEKVEDAWFAHPPNPVGLFVMATTACNRWLSDGVIRPRWIERKLPKERERAQVLATMVEVGLLDLIPAGDVLEVADSDDEPVVLGPFDEARYVVHDFLDRHDSKRQVEERRARDSKRKRDGRRKDSARSPRGHRPDSSGSPDDPSRAGAPPDPTRPDPTPIPLGPPPAGERKREIAKWERKAVEWSLVIGVRGTDATILRALRQAKPWTFNGAAAQEFRDFARQYFASTLEVSE